MESKRQKKNGLFAIDAVTGKEYLSFTDQAKISDIATYIVKLASDLNKEKIIKLTLILDNNSTHKVKMKKEVMERLATMPKMSSLKLEFVHTPAYSPDYNLVEYLIHLLRTCSKFNNSPV
jgi:hypothetical protein